MYIVYREILVLFYVCFIRLKYFIIEIGFKNYKGKKCFSYVILRNFKGLVEMVNKCKLKIWVNICNDCYRYV